MSRLGIHLRLFLTAVFLISASTFALGAVGIAITREFLTKRFTDQMSFLARYVALNAEIGLLVGEKELLERLARNLLSEEDVASVAISDAAGEVLADVSKKVDGPLSRVEAPVFLRKSVDATFLFSSAIPAKTLESPSGKQLGAVGITYSTHRVEEVVHTIALRFLWFSAGLTALAALIFHVVSRSIVIPVTRLADAARQVGEGNLAVRVDPGKLSETRHLALAFNAMLDSLSESRRALAEADREMMRQRLLAEMGKFALTVAHEVKNPLSIIKSSLDLLKKDPGSPSRDTLTGYMEEEIRRLNRLIEDFLGFARPAKPRFREVELNNLLEQVVVRSELQVNGSGPKIVADIASQASYTRADPDLITRALDNIVKNACQASGERGGVRVRAYTTDNTWVAVVEDDGDGIAAEHLDKLFEPFFTTRSKGTGLGLAFASQVIRSHGGKILAENRREGGARFTVELGVRTETKSLGRLSTERPN